MRFLVTAGNTREKIDDVRDWGNVFTGNTGYRIARTIAALGEVDLVTSNRSHLAEVEAAPSAQLPIQGHAFTSHSDLRSLLEGLMQRNTYDAVFMSAAVADYRPGGVFAIVNRTAGDHAGEERWVVRDVQAGKVRSTHRHIAVVGEQTEKIVDLFRSGWNHAGLLVKFKLEVGLSREALIDVGQASRRASGADYLVANTLDMVEGPDAGAFLLSETGHEWIPRDALAARMSRLIKKS
jgi:phosphopantothenate---cysteine ligase (CTP)